MPETAQRRLVKSPPEIWSEISDAQSLARRLSALGEVRITRIEPETTVAWEGASIRGTVELEASGWGTKVTLTAERELEAPAQEPQPAPAEPEPAITVQDTMPFDSSAVTAAATDVDEAGVAPAAQPTTETCADAEATGTDIPPQAPSPAPREEGFLARLKGWWHSGHLDARRTAPVPGTAPAAAETPANRPELQPPTAETDPAPGRIAAPEVEPTVRAERVPATPSDAAAAEAPAKRAELQPPHAESDPARDPELEGLLVQILDDLGAAHHRPFSRA